MNTNEHVKVLEQMRASGFDYDFDNEQYAAIDAAIAALGGGAQELEAWRALLEERDELAKDAARYRCLSAMATQQADSLGPIFRIDVRRSEPYLFNFDAAVDAMLEARETR